MADLPIDLGDGLAERLARVLDVERKIPRTLEALGPVGGRDVLLLHGADGIRTRQLAELGARVTFAGGSGPAKFDAPDGSADVLVGMWSSFRGAEPAEITEAERVLRPGGRLLVVHDYGRDDVSRLRGDQPEYGTWGRRGGPFLGHGFKVRVVHCFWTFDSMEDARDFLGAAFGDAGREVAAGLKRPRLSYNVAVYHRTLGEALVNGAAAHTNGAAAHINGVAAHINGVEPINGARTNGAAARANGGAKPRVMAAVKPRKVSAGEGRVNADGEPGTSGAEPRVTSVPGPRVDSGAGGHH